VWNWNTQGIRRQKIELPTGVPDHIFAFPTRYGGKQCGIIIPGDILADVAELSGVLDASINVCDEELYKKCMQIMPSPKRVKASELVEAWAKLMKHTHFHWQC